MFRLVSQKFDMENPVYTIEEIDDNLNKRGEVREGAIEIAKYTTFEEANIVKDIYLKFDSMSKFDRDTLVKNFAKKNGWTESNCEQPEGYCMEYVDYDILDTHDFNVYIGILIQESKDN